MCNECYGSRYSGLNKATALYVCTLYRKARKQVTYLADYNFLCANMVTGILLCFASSPIPTVDDINPAFP